MAEGEEKDPHAEAPVEALAESVSSVDSANGKLSEGGEVVVEDEEHVPPPETLESSAAKVAESAVAEKVAVVDDGVELMAAPSAGIFDGTQVAGLSSGGFRRFGFGRFGRWLILGASYVSAFHVTTSVEPHQKLTIFKHFPTGPGGVADGNFCLHFCTTL